MSKRHTCANMLRKIYSSLDDVQMHVEYFNEKIEEWETNWYNDGQENNYIIKRNIESICSAAQDLDKAKNACFWLEAELVEERGE